jgi:hypothetical protein
VAKESQNEINCPSAQRGSQVQFFARPAQDLEGRHRNFAGETAREDSLTSGWLHFVGMRRGVWTLRVGPLQRLGLASRVSASKQGSTRRGYWTRGLLRVVISVGGWLL